MGTMWGDLLRLTGLPWTCVFYSSTNGVSVEDNREGGAGRGGYAKAERERENVEKDDDDESSFRALV
jgi:hypothetical protein